MAPRTPGEERRHRITSRIFASSVAKASLDWRPTMCRAGKAKGGRGSEALAMRNACHLRFGKKNEAQRRASHVSRYASGKGGTKVAGGEGGKLCASARLLLCYADASHRAVCFAQGKLYESARRLLCCADASLRAVCFARVKHSVSPVQLWRSAG
jgi:hypothetical protein